MGGCAGKLKNADDETNSEPLPVEKAEAETGPVAQESNDKEGEGQEKKNDGGEEKKDEAPLVDLSEEKREAAAVVEEPVPKPATENKVETPAVKSDEKKEEAAVVSKEPEVKQPDATPAKVEDKSAAPLVAV